MDDLLNEFLTETWESIDTVDVQLVELEKDPNNSAVLDNIFRLVHTIKGTCGFLDLPRLEAVAHAGENVLGLFRDGTLPVTPDSVTVILESLDRIKDIMGVLEETGSEPDGNDAELIARLDAIVEGGDNQTAADKPPAGTETGDKAPADEAVKAPDDADPEAGKAEEEDFDTRLGRELRPGEVSLDELEAVFQSTPGPGEGSGQETDSAAAAEDDNSLLIRAGGADTVTVAGHLTATRVGSLAIKGAFGEGLKDGMANLFMALFNEDLDEAEKIGTGLVKNSGLDDKGFTAFAKLVSAIMEEVGIPHEPCTEAMAGLNAIKGAMIEASKARGNSAKDAQPASADGKPRSTQSIRVNVDLLEDLMNMVSELVLTRNQLMQMVRKTEDSEFTVPLQRLSQCTTELQESVMKTRMQPIGNAWSKLPRIVRDLAHELDKEIELEMVGADTELDRQVLELIKDPLTHMVRNSADHGIESKAQRAAAGKPEKGTVRLNAYHEGGHIIIEIKDDGKGIPVKQIKAKAIDKGLITASEAEDMSDSQIQKLIFHPGLSTAEKVTNISGRGVGMDVVRSNIEKIGGTIDLNSVEGEGSVFMIKIPLTLAIVSALIVQASGERFAIPQISVLELVRASSDSENRIEKIKATPVLRLRNRLLPLVYLSEILGMRTREETEQRATDESIDDFVVVAQVGAFSFGIVVDQVFDTEEIVVKPVAPILKDLTLYSGNTILGDGSVIMILDPNGVAELANSKSAELSEEEEGDNTERAALDEKETMLLFRSGGKTPRAVPLSLVSRLEDIDVERIEESDGRTMVQYRGHLMPIVKANGNFELSAEGRQPVIVFSDEDRTMGLAVEEILDIVEDKLQLELDSETNGVIGSAIINDKATELIDVSWYLDQAFRDRLRRKSKQKENIGAGKSVLLVDDSAFFRNMLKPLLTASGYDVTTATTAEEALKLKDEGMRFDLIISDIEMPGLSGFEFAEAVRDTDEWSKTPLVALSNHASDKDRAKGRKAGFAGYVAKYDRDVLLDVLAENLDLKGEVA